MTIRAQACAWIAGVALVAPLPAIGQDRNERDVVDLIVREGPQAAAIRAETEVTRREQLARLAYPNPALTYSREGAGFTEFLQIEQSLPISGVRSLLSRAGVAATAAAEAERDARLWSLRAEAAAIVARLMAGQDRLAEAESHALNIERLIGILRVREREGEGSRFDRVRAEQELRESRHAVTAAAVSVAEARTTLSAMLPPGTPLGRIAGAPVLQPIPPLDPLVARAALTRAELRALQRAGDQADREADAARRNRIPTPTIVGGMKRADQGNAARAQGVILGLSASVPLFDAGGREAARWAAERARIDAERLAAADRISAEIRRAFEVLTLRQRAAADDQAPADDELMRIAEIAYREGEVGILELLDAARTASTAAVRSIDIRLQARLAQIALERAVGEVLWP